MPLFVFFKIGDTDLTPFMDVQGYEMNETPVFESWTDGNMIERRNSIRTRRSGSFRLSFISAAGYNSFLSLMTTAKQANGYYAVTAFVQNTNTTETFNAYITYQATSKWDFVNSREYRLVNVTVSEL